MCVFDQVSSLWLCQLIVYPIKWLMMRGGGWLIFFADWSLTCSLSLADGVLGGDSLVVFGFYRWISMRVCGTEVYDPVNQMILRYFRFWFLFWWCDIDLMTRRLSWVSFGLGFSFIEFNKFGREKKLFVEWCRNASLALHPNPITFSLM